MLLCTWAGGWGLCGKFESFEVVSKPAFIKKEKSCGSMISQKLLNNKPANQSKYHYDTNYSLSWDSRLRRNLSEQRFGDKRKAIDGNIELLVFEAEGNGYQRHYVKVWGFGFLNYCQIGRDVQ